MPIKIPSNSDNEDWYRAVAHQVWTGTKLYVQTARTKWAERTATLIKTARLEHASDSCFGMSILLCWSRGGLGNAHTVTVGKSLGCTCPVAMWLCGCVAALLCSVLSRWTSTLLNQPWPHGLAILSCASCPPYCSCLLTPQHPPCPRPWRLRSVRFFFPLVPFASCGTCYPSSATFELCLCAFLCASVTSLKWGCQLHRPDRIALSVSRVCKTSG